MLGKFLAPTIIIVSASVFCGTRTAVADPDYRFDNDRRRPHNLSYSHSGQMDTDGILSPGELRNPGIDYDSAQREGRREEDGRVENRFNDEAAAEDRHHRERESYYRENEQKEHRAEREHQLNEERRREEERNQDRRSWWRW